MVMICNWDCLFFIEFGMMVLYGLVDKGGIIVVLSIFSNIVVFNNKFVRYNVSIEVFEIFM